MINTSARGSQIKLADCAHQQWIPTSTAAPEFTIFNYIQVTISGVVKVQSQ